jgi:hypothetical protein
MPRAPAAVIAAITALVACSPSAQEPPLFAQARAAVQHQLVDPESARFEDMAVNARGNVCGTVNARNSFGGYAGRTGFWYDPRSGEAAVAPVAVSGFGRMVAAHLFALKGCTVGPDQTELLREWEEGQPAAVARRQALIMGPHSSSEK